VPATTALWLNVAGVNDVVLWQVSHGADVTMWLGDLPRAVVLLWQVAQLPATTLAWLNFAPNQPDVLWQVSHDCVVGRCVADIGVATTREPVEWQPSHVFGVPLNTPLT